MNSKQYVDGFLMDPPIIKLEEERAKKLQVDLYLKREDLIHKDVSGNKWRKLKYNLLQARENGKKNLLTFGGAYSNHIAAVAAAGKLFDFNTCGIIRGEAPQALNHTLRVAQANGMQLIFVSRSEYRNKSALLSKTPFQESEAYIIPEGGTNELALKGCREIVSQCDFEKTIDYWCVACGTGGTAAGMITGLKQAQQLIGFSVLKGNFMEGAIRDLLKSNIDIANNWAINNEYHFGGYAKVNATLIQFINDFKKKHQIPLDPIYTGKLLFGVLDLMEKGFFPKGSNVMIVHTGGLQGIAGFNERFGNLIH